MAQHENDKPTDKTEKGHSPLHPPIHEKEKEQKQHDKDLRESKHKDAQLERELNETRHAASLDQIEENEEKRRAERAKQAKERAAVFGFDAPKTVEEAQTLAEGLDPLDNNLPNRIAPEQIFPEVPVTMTFATSVGGPLVLGPKPLEGLTIGDWLKGELESPKDYCRESVTVTSVDFLPTGTVLGKVTATGKYVPLNPTGGVALPGSEAVAAILIYDLPAKAASGDSKVAILARGPAFVYGSKLSFVPDVTGPQKTTALTQLEALGIQVVLEA